ncbi:MAG: adenylate/guanylate cyclase domain-containing protein [Bacteroidota bacterium]
MKKIQRRLAAIMFTDMVGYSAMMQQDEEVARQLRNRHREAFVRNTKAFGGEILQYYGDGTLSIYPSASAAVQCALAIQQELHEPPTVPLRIGIHTGDVSYGDEDVFGDGVNVASRIESLCVPGGIFISGKVYDDIKNVSSIEARSIGMFKLKNILKEVEIFAITNEGVTAPPLGYYRRASPSPATAPRRRKGRKKKFWAGMFALFFGVFGVHRFYLKQRKLGILYLGLTLAGMLINEGLAALVPIMAIISLIDAIIFFSMPRHDFDVKYNGVSQEATEVAAPPVKKYKRKARPKAKPQKSPTEIQFGKYWQKALDEYQEYDYGEAIAALHKAIKLKPNDQEAHFLLARCYSINENVKDALTHLDLAVAAGLKDKGRIQMQSDLAFLRMQPEYEAFVNNGYRLAKPKLEPEPEEDILELKNPDNSPDLLEQLRKLQELREEGQLTEQEYELLMRKLGG